MAIPIRGKDNRPQSTLRLNRLLRLIAVLLPGFFFVFPLVFFAGVFFAGI